jgi:hypothetical protein
LLTRAADSTNPNLYLIEVSSKKLSRNCFPPRARDLVRACKSGEAAGTVQVANRYQRPDRGSLLQHSGCLSAADFVSPQLALLDGGEAV